MKAAPARDRRNLQFSDRVVGLKAACPHHSKN